MTSTRERLLVILAHSSRPMLLSELTKSIDAGTKKKELNGLLYALKERGLVERTIENPPLWSATAAAASSVVLEGDDNASGEDESTMITQDEHNLVGILVQQGKEHGMSASSLAAALGKSVAATNKMLYGLERSSNIICCSRHSPPLWKIQSIQSSSTELTHSTSSTRGSDSMESQQTFFEGDKKQAPKVRSDTVGDQKLARNVQSDIACLCDNQGKQQHKRAKVNLGIQVHPNASCPVASSSSITVARKKIRESLSKHHNPKSSGRESAWAKKCGDAVWKKYRRLNPDAKDNDIVAGFIVHEQEFPAETCNAVRVVAIGSGTKCASGAILSCDGKVVHDSHAEVVARRSLHRWLYCQLKKAGNAGSIAVKNKKGSDKPYSLRPLYLWLYISQTPCGDSAVYSREAPNVNLCWQRQHAGSFRIKVEDGQGSVFAPREAKQSLDGFRLGDRVMHNSCSDKIAKWCVLGVQGALLSRLVNPIYVTGVVVGDVFSHGHICRAICCRSAYALKITNATLQKPYEVKHPRIRNAPRKVPRSIQIMKKGKFCYNWAEQDSSSIEAVDGVTGRLASGKESRICKKKLFECFSKLHTAASEKPYSENKALALPYQRSKKTWKNAMKGLFGSWTEKPSEVDDFRLFHQSPF